MILAKSPASFHERDADNNGSLDECPNATQDTTSNVTSLISNSTSSNVRERFLNNSNGARTDPDASFSTSTHHKNRIIGYQGLRYNTAIGLYDNRNRVYSPTMMRFAQAEPSGADYVDGTNLYWGREDNPIIYVDPLGLAAATAPAVLMKISVRLGAEIPLRGLQWSDWDLVSDNTKGAPTTASVEGDSPEFKTTVNWVYAADDPSKPGKVYGSKDYTYELAVKLELVTGPCSRVKGTINAKDITIDYHLSHSPAGKSTWTVGEHSNGTIKAGWTTAFEGGDPKATKPAGTFSYGGPFSIIVDHVETGHWTDDRYQSTTAGTIAIDGTYFTK